MLCFEVFSGSWNPTFSYRKSLRMRSSLSYSVSCFVSFW